MIKIMLLITRRPEMSREEFIDYYENRHIPLVEKLLPPLPYYRRNYLTLDDPLTFAGEQPPDFDVITEIEFPTRVAADAWFARWQSPEIREQIVTDEEKFVTRSSTRLFSVEEHNSEDRRSRSEFSNSHSMGLAR